MKIFLGYLLTPLFIATFALILLLIHPLMVIADLLFGYTGLKFVLEIMNISIILALKMIGTRIKVRGNNYIPKDRPLIIVSNHQSMFDIPLLLLYFRKYHPKFVAKIELSRGIPSISYALRNIGTALINRKDQDQSLAAIKALAEDCVRKNHSVCIFPEGTRARDGKMKTFKTGGLITLLSNMPNAVIVPVVIKGSWEILRYNFWPVPFGCLVEMRVLSPLEQSTKPPIELCNEIEIAIGDTLKL